MNCIKLSDWMIGAYSSTVEFLIYDSSGLGPKKVSEELTEHILITKPLHKLDRMVVTASSYNSTQCVPRYTVYRACVVHQSPLPSILIHYLHPLLGMIPHPEHTQYLTGT